MKTTKHEEMRKEYKREDLGKGIRGKYFEEYKKGTNLLDEIKKFEAKEKKGKASFFTAEDILKK